jgi:hypothetical protein
LVAVIEHYLKHRAASLPSIKPAERACQLLTQWLFEVRNLPRSSRADAFGLDLQQQFIRWAAAQGHSAKYISRNLSVIAAAMHYAAKEQAVDDGEGGRRIVRLMSQAPAIRYDPGWIAEVATIEAPQRRSWIPAIEEMARFIDCIRSEHLFRFVIIALNTWARAEAIMELDLKKQVDLDAGLLDLNPPGRRQTLKRRPIIRLTRNLHAWRAEWKVARPLAWHGEAIDNIKKGMQATNARWMMGEADVPAAEIERLMRNSAGKERTKVLEELEAHGAHRITRRVIRTFMATRVRGLKEIRVDREQRQLWLGHARQDTTSMYEITDSDYLREAAEATDMIIDKINLLTKRSLWPAGVQPMLPFVLRGARNKPGSGFGS